MIKKEIILLGDSIFDNASYVSSGESVTEQLTELCEDYASVTLLAVDGNVMADVSNQLKKISKNDDAKIELYLSCGGNDLLNLSYQGLLTQPSQTVADALTYMYTLREGFRTQYQQMLDKALKISSNLIICTIYDAIPLLPDAEKLAIGIFNEVILAEAAKKKLDVIDLRLLCDQKEDFSPVSPIEPSVHGAKKIAAAIYIKSQTTDTY